jgi:carboxyl-terminal processing protease
MSHPPSEGRRRRWLWIASLLAAAVIGSQGARAVPEAASPFRNLGIFARALSHVELSYVDDVDQDQLIHGAIRGMLGTLDPHSTFMDPEQYRILTSDTEGRFGGVGVEISVRDGWLTVMTVFDGGPADRAGMKPGDRFLAIEGRKARDMRMEEAVRRMRGEPGTQVRVTLRRDGEPKDIDLVLTREVIEVQVVQGRVLPDRVVYVRVKAFQKGTTGEVRRVLDEAVARTRDDGGVSGVILDLRDNAGGLLDEAVLMADEFVSNGIIVSTRGRGKRVLNEARAHGRGTRPEWPMVVLVNGFSASASEIVAGALQDHVRAVVVGTRTFGKGSVQTLIELPDDSALKLTIARYYTPNGRSIQAHGIEPDMLVEQLDADALAAARTGPAEVREDSLERHLEDSEAAPPSPAVAEPPDRDVPRSGPARTADPRSPFADDFQARMAHQALRALIRARSTSGGG